MIINERKAYHYLINYLANQVKVVLSLASLYLRI